MKTKICFHFLLILSDHLKTTNLQQYTDQEINLQRNKNKYFRTTNILNHVKRHWKPLAYIQQLKYTYISGIS